MINNTEIISRFETIGVTNGWWAVVDLFVSRLSEFEKGHKGIFTMETKWHLQTTLEEVLPVFSPSSQSQSGSLWK